MVFACVYVEYERDSSRSINRIIAGPAYAKVRPVVPFLCVLTIYATFWLLCALELVHGRSCAQVETLRLSTYICSVTCCSSKSFARNAVRVAG
jgi:hypothetical protein